MKANRLYLKRLMAVLVGVFLIAALPACSRPDRTVKTSEDWSRGQRLDYASLLQLSALAVEPDGRRVHVVWSGREAEGEDTELYYAQLDDEGTKLIQRVLPFLFLPRQPRLVVASDGYTHLFTLARRDARSPDGLFYMLLDADGSIVGEGLQLSSTEHKTLNYAVAASRGGSVEVFWATEEEDSIWLSHLRIGPDGATQSAERRIAEGAEPTAQVDQDGAIHLAWLGPTSGRDRRMRYTSFDRGQVEARAGVEVGSIPATGVGVRKPIALGLDERRVYIFWSVEWRSGLSAGSAEAVYVHFPLGRPQDAISANVWVPEDAEAYSAQTGPVRESEAYALQHLVLALPGSMGRTSGFLEAPRPVAGQRGELAVVVSAGVQFRRDDESQIILALFKDGQVAAYEMAGRTADYSQWPEVVADERGDLHMVWLDYDTSAGHSVYYASTAATVGAQLDTRTTQDILLGGADAAWGMLSGLSLLPLVVMLMLPVILWCGLFYIFGADDSLEKRGPLIAFAIALVIYFLGKMMVLSPVLVLPPGLSMVPGWLRGAWPILVMVFIAAIAGLGFWRIYWRRVERRALFSAVLWFTLADAVLSVLLYGTTFFGN